MEVSGNRKHIWIPLDISPLFFHILSKIVQALFVTYDGIFQALVVKGYILLLKPFLDPISATIQP
jgi:hypothetical protein